MPARPGGISCARSPTYDFVDLGLRGRGALVTGASRGIGLAIATSLTGEGARVAMVARGEEQLRRSATAAGGVPVVADLSEEAGCVSAFQAAREAIGEVDILVNNLGGRAGSSWADTGSAELAEALNINLYAAVRMTKLALPGMRRRGWGRIVVVTSVYGREAGGAPAYNAAKAAEISFVHSLGREVGADGVTVNGVAPGSILFEGGSWWRRREADPDGIADFVQREMPLGRFGTPEEVASVVSFLCSEPARLVNGATWTVDGGQSRSNL